MGFFCKLMVRVRAAVSQYCGEFPIWLQKCSWLRVWDTRHAGEDILQPGLIAIWQRGPPDLEGRRFELERSVLGSALAPGCKHPLAGRLVKCWPCSPSSPGSSRALGLTLPGPSSVHLVAHHSTKTALNSSAIPPGTDLPPSP